MFFKGIATFFTPFAQWHKYRQTKLSKIFHSKQLLESDAALCLAANVAGKSMSLQLLFLFFF